METKNAHIDSFLATKLKDFSAVPQDNMWAKINTHIQHLNYPVDASMNRLLSEIEISPNTDFSKTLLSELPHSLNVIDLVLHQKLDTLTYNPKQETWQNIKSVIGENKKRRFMLWWLVVPILLGGIASYHFFVKNLTSTPSSENTISKSNINKLNLPPQKYQELQATDNVISKKINRTPINKISEKIRRVEYKNANLISKNSSIMPNGYFFNNNTVTQENEQLKLNYYSYKLLKLNISDFKAVKNALIEKQKSVNLNKKRLSPFSFSLTAGYINQKTNNAKILTNNVHKDALKLFEAATGNQKNGQQISLSLGYRFKSIFDIRLGLNFLQTANSSPVNYTYYEVPLYNTNGIIIGYGTRPASLSPKVNQNSITENKTYSIPVQLFTMIAAKNKWSVWGGIGSEFKLNQHYKTQLFSFENGRMESLSKTQFKESKILPTAQLLFNYQYRTQWHLLCQIQTGYQSNNYFIDNVHYKKNEWTPSIKLGIQFNPLIQ